MRLRTVLAVAIYGSLAGCDCAGCSSTDAAKASGEDWSVTVTCASTTKLGAIGAAHAGGIIYPDGCDVAWKVEAHGKAGVARTMSITGASPASKGCSETKAFCKSAKAVILSRGDGDEVVVAVSAGSAAHGIYLLDHQVPIAWPASLPESEALRPLRDARDKGDAAALLAALPSPDALVSSMLAGDVPADYAVLNTLTGARYERHRAELGAALRRCGLISSATAPLFKAHPDLGADLYAGAFHGAEPCAENVDALMGGDLTALAPHLRADLEACTAACDSLRLEELASLADVVGTPEVVRPLVSHLEPPKPEAWIKDEDRARDAFVAWHASAFAVARHLPGEARPKLLAAFGRTSTHRLPEDAGPDELDADDVELEPPRAPVRGGAYRQTAKRLAELLLLVDDPALRDALHTFAREPKRDRGVRQLSIAYLSAVNDPRAKTLLDAGVLTSEQEATIERLHAPPPPAADAAAGDAAAADAGAEAGTDAGADAVAAPPRRRRHHHH